MVGVQMTILMMAGREVDLIQVEDLRSLMAF